jgi:hypothetical protein
LEAYQASWYRIQVLFIKREGCDPSCSQYVYSQYHILICWTVISPLQWERVSVDSIQLWNTVGVCANENGAVEKSCWIAIGCINIGALILSCWQAYQARNHSDELSEAKGIGFATFSWFQLTLIGVPISSH